jgi:hypothetical protein
MPPAIADVRKLADRLQRVASRGARLTPESARLALIALRVYADLLETPSVAELGNAYRVETLNSAGDTDEVLSVSGNALIARAAFEEAVKQRQGRALRLRQGARVIAENEEARAAP